MSEPKLKWKLDNEQIDAVIMAAVWAEGQRQGVWQKMLQALDSGAAKTKEGTVNAFLFRAMVNSLLEEFHALDSEEHI